MRMNPASLALVGLAAPSLAFPKRDDKPGPDAEKAKQIKDAYVYSWRGYYNHAFPNDTLTPLNNSYINDR
jgi:mannosyl-oligosaccharide alpha-1,2-mannosidase